MLEVLGEAGSQRALEVGFRSHCLKQESDKTTFTLASDEEWVLGEDRDHSWPSRRRDLGSTTGAENG